MKPKNYGKNILSIITPVKFHLPDGSIQFFKNSTEALLWFILNYASEYSMVDYVPTLGDSPKTTPTRRGVDRLSGANYSSRFNAASAKLGINPLNWFKHIPKSYWDSDIHKAVVSGGNAAAALISAPFALYGLEAAYSVPAIAGALNLYGAYDGIERLTSDEGVTKTYNKFKSEDYLGGAMSLGGDVLDAMSLLFLNRVMLNAYNAAKPAVLGYQMNRSIPSTYLLKGSLLIPEGKPYMSEFNFGKESGYAVHADKGDRLGMFTSDGAYIEDGILFPGLTLSGQRNFTWWNEDKLFSPGFNFGKPYLRVIVSRKEDIPGLLRVREMNEPVGLWRPGKRSLVQKSELVTSEPTDLSSSLIYLLDPYEASIGHRVYVRLDMPRMSIYSQEEFPSRDFFNPQLGVRTSGIHRLTTTGNITGSRNIDIPSKPGPIDSHNSRITSTEIVEPSSVLRVTNAGEFYPIPRGAYHPEGIDFTRDILMGLGFRPSVKGTWINPENGIKIFNWTSNHNWPVEVPSNRWLSNKESNWMWTDLTKQPITLWHKSGGKLKNEKH